MHPISRNLCALAIDSVLHAWTMHSLAGRVAATNVRALRALALGFLSVLTLCCSLEVPNGFEAPGGLEAPGGFEGSSAAEAAAEGSVELGATTQALVALPNACPGLPTEEESSSLFHGRPCRGDSLLIELPEGQSPPSRDFEQYERLSTTILTRMGTEWFCRALGECKLDAIVEPLLPPRPGAYPAERATAHHRFFRVRFVDGDNGSLTPVEIPPESQCAAIQAVRDALTQEWSAQPGVYHVARECDASALQTTLLPSSSFVSSGLEPVRSSALTTLRPTARQRMLNWHEAVLDIEPLLPRRAVDIALIDSGVSAAISSLLGVTTVKDFTNDPGGALHDHGDAMALYLHDVAPQANIYSYRVIDQHGQARSGALAQAIDAAIYESTSTNPLVINLSVGWSSELSHATHLSGASCLTWEDPIGEAARFMLRMARRIDAGQRPVFVASAAGNQPLATPEHLIDEAPNAPGTSANACATGSAASPWFWPAQLHRLASCDPGHDPLRVSFAVGATDSRDEPSLVSIQGAPETPLVAPGEHVYASHPSIGDHLVSCTSNAFPRAVSGTSVSTAFVAAAAARAQSLVMRPLDAERLGRALYLAGSETGRTGFANAPVRRLHIGNVDRLASIDCLSLIRACTARQSAVEEVIPPGLVHLCQGAIETCGFVSNPAAGVGWDQFEPCATSNMELIDLSGESWQTAPICESSGFPQQLLGSLGPQPNDPLCPDCRFDWINRRAMIWLNPAYTAPFNLYAAYLIVYNPTSSEVLYLPTNNWYPGKLIYITLPNTSPTNPDAALLYTLYGNAANLWPLWYK